MDASYPPGGDVESSGLDAGIPAYVDRLLNVSHPRTRFQMRMLFFLFEHVLLPDPNGVNRLRS